ncbi:hypothetical protein IGI37_000196 [Enterococcus sp. AZ194]|uniref:kinase n=1 Tax=Enterococcus sp. AZ194 TaxID=2774629 RepID=UPI003F1FB783
MTTLILIRGNSGSGKTTLAQTLQKRLEQPCLLISQDIVRRNMLMAKDGPETPTISLLINLLLYGKKNYPFVIIEGILHSEWYAPLFEAIKRELPTTTFAYYYDLPFAETTQRHATKQAPSFTEEDMKRWWNEKDFVSILQETLLTKELSLEATVEKIIQDVKGI